MTEARDETMALLAEIEATAVGIEAGLARCLGQLREMNADLLRFAAERHQRLAAAREV